MSFCVVKVKILIWRLLPWVPHIDTVVQGGAYDGTVGVVGALEVLYMLQDEELERPIEVIIFRAEESSVLALLPSAVTDGRCWRP